MCSCDVDLDTLRRRRVVYVESVWLSVYSFCVVGEGNPDHLPKVIIAESKRPNHGPQL